jgi:hypothetical protein
MERAATFTFDCTDEMGFPVQKRLVAELMGRTCNLYLLSPEGRILDCLRRIGLDEYPVKMTNPNNNNGGNRWPNMLPYGDSDVTSNPNVGAAFGSGNDAGMYIFSKKVWWAK